MIDLLLVSNDKFFPYLTTLLMSVAASTPAPLRANIVTNDASADSRRHVAQAVPSIDLRWLDCGSLLDLPPSLCGVDPISYGRLFGPGQLEGKVERLIYLDVDMLVRHDLTELWKSDLEGNPVAAVRDPWVISIGHSTLGIPDYDALGFSAAAPYFNSGVMVIDVKRWNTDGTENRCLEFLSTQRINRFADQDALNAIFCGSWTPLPMRWNVFAHPPQRPLIGVRKSTREVIAAQIDPAIVHYAGSEKPWAAHHGSKLLFLDEWQSFATSGSFSGRPKRLTERFRLEIQSRLTGATRALLGR